MLFLTLILYGFSEVVTTALIIPIFYTVALVGALVLSWPLMKLRQYVGEPYYLFIFVVTGFVGGIVAINLFAGRNLTEEVAWETWLILQYGTLGAVCAFSSWLYLKKHERVWAPTT